MKNDKEAEQILLSDEKYEDFLRSKTENDFKQILENTKNHKKSVITDFKQMPKDKLFSKNATYFVINKKSKTYSHINGMQAEAYLVSPFEREKFLSKVTDYFVYQDSYIKFQKYDGEI